MSPPYFADSPHLVKCINSYFDYLDGEFHYEDKPGKVSADQPVPQRKVYDREPEPATLAGLALHLGFNSVQAFEDYVETGELSETLKWGRLRIEAYYEKKLHAQSSTGAIFVLKKMGWTDKYEPKPTVATPTVMDIVVHNSGPLPAGNEKDVVL
ncbi:MAG: DNA-packaging protein [Bacteroidota bacterium]|nr:DNA-packaging protein [Bacteroidota bacterium]